MSGSGSSCNRRLITAGEAKSKKRNNTQLPPAALNYFSTTGFLFPLFSVSFLVWAALLFVFDLSPFPVIFFPSASSSISISWPPHPPLYLFLDLCFLLAFSLPACICSLLGPCGDSGFGVSGQFYWVCSGYWKGLFTDKVMKRCIKALSNLSNPSKTNTCLLMCMYLSHVLTFCPYF